MTDASKAAAKDAPSTDLYVRDMTATSESGPRTHDMIVQGAVEPFTFKPGKALKMPRHIAVKFLKHGPAAFRLCDADGNFVDWHGVPKQPSELQAGERFRIEPNQTVANLSELTNEALWMRCVAMPGGEEVAEKNDRKAMIDFIVEVTVKRRRENTEADRGEDEFVPEADLDMVDEAA